jgi:hydrogenase maturation protease
MDSSPFLVEPVTVSSTDPSSPSPATLVIGIGNPLRGDDGLGSRALEMLAREDIPEGVELMELGTPGWGLVTTLQDRQRVVIIDAVRMGQKPGAWRRFSPQEVRFITQDETLSMHEPGLAESLELAQALDWLPDEIIIYGVEPTSTGFGSGLSPEVEGAIPTLITNILGDLWKTPKTKNESC